MSDTDRQMSDTDRQMSDTDRQTVYGAMLAIFCTQCTHNAQQLQIHAHTCRYLQIFCVGIHIPTDLSVGMMQVFHVDILQYLCSIFQVSVGMCRYVQGLKIREIATRIDTYTYLQYPAIPTDTFEMVVKYLQNTYVIPSNTYQNIKAQHTYLQVCAVQVYSGIVGICRYQQVFLGGVRYILREQVSAGI